MIKYYHIMSENQKKQLLLCATSCLLINRRSKRIWIKEWLKRRESLSQSNALLAELRLEPADFKNYLRMDEGSYQELLRMVTPYIRKQDSNFRKSITPHERLSATLRFLITGKSYEDLKFDVCISPQTLSTIIPETYRAIVTVLKEYMKVGIIKTIFKT